MYGCCCVIDCKNTWRKSDVRFLYFPWSKCKWDQKLKWTNAVKMNNSDGSEWSATNFARICSTHFIYNGKSNNPSIPSYVPKIFPDLYKKRKLNPNIIENRYNRLMDRRAKKASKEEEKFILQNVTSNIYVYEDEHVEADAIEYNYTDTVDLPLQKITTVDAACRVYFGDAGATKCYVKLKR